MHQVFSEHTIDVPNLQRVVELLDLDDDGTLDFDEIVKGVTPAAANRMRREPMYSLSVEQRKVFQQAWMESLAYVFGVIVSVDAELEHLRE